MIPHTSMLLLYFLDNVCLICPQLLLNKFRKLMQRNSINFYSGIEVNQKWINCLSLRKPSRKSSSRSLKSVQAHTGISYPSSSFQHRTEKFTKLQLSIMIQMNQNIGLSRRSLILRIMKE